jgi:hypothetical protein
MANKLMMKGGENEMKEITCEHCKYTWKTNSEMVFVTCPSCMKKTRVNNQPQLTENVKS